MNFSKIDISRAYDYVSSKEENKEWTAIRLTDLTGKYSDIVYTYGKVSFGDETENGEMPLTFHYDVVLSKDIEESVLKEDIDFKNLLGDILIDILTKQIEEGNLQYVNTDNRKNNTQ